MKKICFVTTIYGTYKAFIWNFASYLHNTGEYEIYLICKEEEQIKTHLQDFVHYIPVKMERGFSLSAFQTIKELIGVFKKYRFDFVQYSTPNASFCASIAAKIAKIPVRLYCQWGMVFVGFQGIKRKIFKLEEKLVCALSTWIEPDSHGNLEFAHKEGLYPKDKGSVVWNGSACGINLEKFDISKKELYRSEIRNQYNIPNDAFVYCFVGRINRDKGINELLEAYKNILSKNSYLILIGSEEDDAHLNQELLAWSKNNSQIIYTGHVPDVERYLSCADVYILPSYREGFGMGVVEAEAMGLPVIVSDIPGPTDAMSENVTGIIVKKADVDSLQQAMITIHDDNNLREQLSKNSCDYVKNNFEQKQLFEHILADRKKLLGEK